MIPDWLKSLKLGPPKKTMAEAPDVAAAARLFRTERRTNGKRPDLDEQVYRLRNEVTVASGLITQLAEQHCELVKTIKVLRARTSVLLAVSVATSLALAALLIAAAIT
ncbi:MAG TPA: hypothetical protein VKF40_07075 [Burkholderiales bacterium]|nr:hypothetical protein [Burkholderiales bacterium]